MSHKTWVWNPPEEGLTSIIMPCYILPDKNAELLFWTCDAVDSIRNTVEKWRYELIIVDNGSPIGEDSMMRMADVYVRNATNQGYAKAINQGFSVARGEWLVAMNNDVTVMGHWLDEMQEAFFEGVGAISAHLHDSNPNHTTGLRIVLPKEMFGALWMTRREVLQKVGLLDEGYEIGHFEDKDFWMRLKAHGYELIKTSWCNHIGNATWGKMPHQQEIYLKNKAHFEARWGEDALR